MAVLNRPDDPLLILLRFGVIILSVLTIYTSLRVEITPKYALVSTYTALLACYTAIWTSLHAFNWISTEVYDDWKYVAGASIYLAVIGKDIRYIYAAHRRRDNAQKLEYLASKMED